MTPIEQYMRDYAALWYEVDQDPEDFVWTLADWGVISWDDAAFYVQQYYYVTPEPPAWPREIVLPTEEELPPPPYVTTPEEMTPAERKAYIEKELFDYQKKWYELSWNELLKAFWDNILKNITGFFDTIWTWVKAKLTDIWEWVKLQFQELARAAYESILREFVAHSPIRPEDAPGLAGSLFGLATASGMMAHGLASLTEAGHPYKNLGLQYSAGFLGELAGWGRISSATVGIYMTRVLAQAMTYYVQDKHRPLIPDEKLLQIMAVKPDISPEQFRQGMSYQGYSEEWIDAVQRTMYHEPRYFELKMMSEDEAASEDWLFLKSRRAGFTEQDSKIMVSSYLKTATRTQRLDYYRQGFYLYKEGYISKGEFGRMLDELELRPEAKVFCMRAAELAYLNDYIRDMISYYNDSFQKDIIDEDELLVSFLGLGVVADRAWLLTAKAKVRKRPKPRREVDVTVKKALTDIQKKHITLYVTQYRKDLITESELLESLLSIELDPDLAEVTVAIEAAKKGLVLPAS